MVVPVLIVSCQTSEKPSSGPDAAQTATAATATPKTGARPMKAAAPVANRLNRLLRRMADGPPRGIRAANGSRRSRFLPARDFFAAEGSELRLRAEGSGVAMIPIHRRALA
ncbi:hypothetical protein STAQ_11770 [Allostella sp. ATCC 35155]|nr:hypothetical protein STAQ_11770 [Stella sp. ATCC 35155]